MGPLAVIFSQPELYDFPGFIQRPEQVKIQYFCTVRPVEPFDKRIRYEFVRRRYFGK